MAIDKKPYTILYVEDEKTIRERYTEFLRRYFTSVYAAKDGVEAYYIYKKVKPHIMLIDIVIPKLNGLDLLKKIRLSDQNTKAIITTAHTDTKHLLKASELKLTKYLVKPVTIDELKMALSIAENELQSFQINPLKRVHFNENYVWNYDSDELSRDGVVIAMTNKEQAFLLLLLEHPNKVISYDKIVEVMWANTHNDKQDSLKTIVKNLRKKLPKDVIKNIFGVGFKIVTS